MTGAGSTIQTTTVRSGTYAGRITSLASGTRQGFEYQFALTESSGPFFFRFYVLVHTAPSGSQRFVTCTNTASLSGSTAFVLHLKNDASIDIQGAGAIVGTSSAMTLDTWNLVEVKFDKTPASGSQILEAKLNGTVFATSSAQSFTHGCLALNLGANLSAEAQTTGDWYFDDIAINDNTGGSQTTYAGAGQIIHLQPNAAGDNNQFTSQTGGTAGSANNFTRVDEVTPDDGTSFNGDTVVGHIDDFNITNTPSSIGSGDTINVVAIGVRATGAGIGAACTFNVRCKKTSAGTVSSGSNITIGNTTWVTNSANAPFNPSLTLYNDPDGSAWTKSTLDTAQIGYTINTNSTNAQDISTVWMMVDSTPGTTTVSTGNFFAFFDP